MPFKKITKLVNPAEFQTYIDTAIGFETISHTYGQPQPAPSSHTYWMEYKNNIGSISFTRNTVNHPILKEMVEKILTLLTPIFSKDSPPNPLRVHIIRTINSINPHIDEARACCINIGIRNSSNAILQVSNDNIRNTFAINHEDHILEDGDAYILNTENLHALVGIDQPRYLITYSFGTSYDETLSKLNLK